MPAKILLCLDADPQPSVFDAVVAIDAGADHLLRHGGVTPADVQGLVHGAMFTRGPKELAHTAIFIGGSDITAAEALFREVPKAFFGPIRNSVLLDPNGANTTAAAAVLTAGKHVTWNGATAAIIGTGPVGRRVAKLLAAEGVDVRLASRSPAKAAKVGAEIDANLVSGWSSGHSELAKLLDGVQSVFAAGPAGVEVLPMEVLAAACSSAVGPQVAIDLNAAPPVGIGGVGSFDKGVLLHGCACYGALAVGGLKMKLHKRAIQELFTRNDALLDAAEVYALGKELVS